jgi:hypothetical protein
LQKASNDALKSLTFFYERGADPDVRYGDNWAIYIYTGHRKTDIGTLFAFFSSMTQLRMRGTATAGLY